MDAPQSKKSQLIQQLYPKLDRLMADSIVWLEENGKIDAFIEEHKDQLETLRLPSINLEEDK